MDLEGIRLNEISQRRQILYNITYTWNLKNTASEYNKKADSDAENKLVVTHEEKKLGGAIWG